MHETFEYLTALKNSPQNISWPHIKKVSFSLSCKVNACAYYISIASAVISVSEDSVLFLSSSMMSGKHQEIKHRQTYPDYLYIVHAYFVLPERKDLVKNLSCSSIYLEAFAT